MAISKPQAAMVTIGASCEIVSLPHATTLERIYHEEVQFQNIRLLPEPFGRRLLNTNGIIHGWMALIIVGHDSYSVLGKLRNGVSMAVSWSQRTCPVRRSNVIQLIYKREVCICLPEIPVGESTTRSPTDRNQDVFSLSGYLIDQWWLRMPATETTSCTERSSWREVHRKKLQKLRGGEGTRGARTSSRVISPDPS